MALVKRAAVWMEGAMKIVEYFESQEKNALLEAVGHCQWEAAKFLWNLLMENSFEKTLGDNGKLFFLLEEEKVVSFLTLTTQDCIVAPDQFPWIGFVYTFPQYRGRHCAGILLEHARKCAADAGFPFVYLATDHVGLYEKYGFQYLENRKCIHNTESRIYVVPASDITGTADAMQRTARRVIQRLEISEAWQSIGAKVRMVGSMAMGLLMKHRDIDFHIYTDRLDGAESFKAIARICAGENVTRMEYRNLAATEEACFEWHVWYNLDGEEWQIDMIQILSGSQFDGYFENVVGRIKAALTPETRRAILELKYLTPATEHIMGIEYYQAVIADGVRTYPQLTQWRRAHPSKGINVWCP
ncbi:MAG: GNAT family N-acetyltransferase [Victivallaceae bacterium]|nr:GNAT family N-acetyltransferase [Victivallaceae bacterium]